MSVHGYKSGSPDAGWYFGAGSSDAGHGYAWCQPISAPTPNAGYHNEVAKLGFYIGANAPPQTVRLALYAGGTPASPVGSRLVAEAEYTAGSTWSQIELTPASSAWVPATGTLWIVAKAAQNIAYDLTSSPMIGAKAGSTYCDGLSPCDLTGLPRWSNWYAEAAGSTAFPAIWTRGAGITATGVETLILWAELTEVVGDPVTGTLAGTLPALTGSAAGTAIAHFTGTLAGTFGTLTGAAAGTVTSSFLAEPLADWPVYYLCTLSAPGEPDYTVAISSFQMRLRQSPGQCYLSVVIPAILDHVDAIDTRIGGTMTLTQSIFDNGEELITADIDAFRLYQGGRSRRGEITAHRTLTFSDPQARTGHAPTYKQTAGGVTRYRMRPMRIDPGDTVLIDGRLLVVSESVWSVTPDRASMEITDG